jgi:hypothetical protein
MACARAPLARTDQPSATEVPVLAALDPAGTLRRESTPRFCWRMGLVARSGGPAGGSEVSSTRPVPVAPAVPAISTTVPEPPPIAGGHTRVAEVTATSRGAAAELAAGAARCAGWESCAAPTMAPSATSTAPAGAR